MSQSEIDRISRMAARDMRLAVLAAGAFVKAARRAIESTSARDVALCLKKGRALDIRLARVLEL